MAVDASGPVAQVAEKGPFQVEVEEGKLYWWCVCGHSGRQPFCDGSHRRTSLTPLEWRAPRTGRVFLCGCKATKRRPLCDGTHKSLP